MHISNVNYYFKSTHPDVRLWPFRPSLAREEQSIVDERSESR